MSNTNWDFLAHILRDVFPHPTFPVIYGGDPRCLDVFRAPLHGLNLWMIYANNNAQPFDDQFMPIDLRIARFKGWHIDFFFALDEDVDIPLGSDGNKALDLKITLAKGAFVMLVNPGKWADDLENYLGLREDLSSEVKKYSMFRDKRVLVYENV